MPTVVRPNVVDVEIVLLAQLAGVPIDPRTVAFQHVDQAHPAAWQLLVHPDHGTVVVPQVPSGANRQRRNPVIRPDAPLALRLAHVLAVVGAWNGCIRVAVVLLADDRLCLSFTALGGDLSAFFGDSLGADGFRVFDAQNLGEPIRVGLRELDQLGEVVAPAVGADEDGPSAVLGQDRTQVGPARRVGQRVFREHHASRRRSDQRVVVVRPDDLPCRPVLEPDEHVVVARGVAQLDRERFVDPALSAVRVHRVPNGLSRLVRHRQHVPVHPNRLHRTAGGPMQADVVLTGPPMPRQGSALLAGPQRSPGRRLIVPRLPVVWKSDLRHPAARSRQLAGRHRLPHARRATTWVRGTPEDRQSM